MTERNGNVTSFDLIYQFSKEDIEKRIEEVRVTVMQQMEENMDNYVWKNIKNLAELERTRMSAMKKARQKVAMCFMNCPINYLMRQSILIKILIIVLTGREVP